MSLTRYRLAESVQRLLSGDDPSTNAKVHLKEIMIASEGVLNRLLKMEFLSVDEKIGQAIPNGASVATYDNISVTAYKNVSKCTLPATPLRLPRDMGVFQIFDPNNVTTLYIPVEMGQAALLPSHPVLNNLLGHVGYERYGADVVFTKDLTTILQPAKVTIRLVVLDMSKYTDYDILPIPADMEMTAIEEVYKLYASEPIADKLEDSSKDHKVNINEQRQS